MARERWKTLGSGEKREIASIPRRFGARLVDDLVLTAVSWVMVIPISDSDTVGALVFLFVIVLCLLLYEVAMTAVLGQTFGKMAAGVEVVRVDDGSVPGWRKSTGRWAVFFLPVAVLSGVVPFLAGLYMLLLFVSVVINPDRQGWHDRVGATMVARRQPGHERVSEWADAPRHRI